MKLNLLRTIARVAFVLSVSLILRADEGCMTEDRTVEGTVPLTLTADWVTKGFTENTATENGNAGAFAQRIIDALDDVENIESIDPTQVKVAGARARVTLNRGHSSARSATINITTTNKAAHELMQLRVPDNQTNREVNASDDGTDLYLRINAAAISALQADFQTFLTEYLAGNLVAAAAALNNISWVAEWSSDDPPTSQDPDDFDWVTEIILHVPAEWDLTVINI
ncbi:MAG TPA: hypothetical protein VGB13_08310 [Candidatus Krumholzibacteria bacterium]|jgi:hypothetical protein